MEPVGKSVQMNCTNNNVHEASSKDIINHLNHTHTISHLEVLYFGDENDNFYIEAFEDKIVHFNSHKKIIPQY